MSSPAPTRKLSTADARREALVSAAIRVFGERGYGAAPTTAIAQEAGISQAYLFRLFPTKADLFIAVCRATRALMLQTFADAAARGRSAGIDPLDAMGTAYVELVRTRPEVLLVQLHGQVAAAEEPRIRESMQETFAELYALVARESQADATRLRTWFAYGMLINTMTALGADQVDAPWARGLTAYD